MYTLYIIVTDTVQIHVYIHGDTYTCSCDYITQLHSITAKCAWHKLYANVWPCVHAYAYTYVDTCTVTYTHTHAHTHTYIHTHTHTHTRVKILCG